MARLPEGHAEWLESDGLGGFASGAVSGVRRRRYHALLLAARRPPVERFVLVNGFDAWVTTSAGTVPISSQLYDPAVVHPDGSRRLEAFEIDPWPRWTWRLDAGVVVEQEIFVPKGRPVVAIAWKIVGRRKGARLSVRPFLSGRDYHSMHHENLSFRFAADPAPGGLVWRPYDGVPAIRALTNGAYREEPQWYRNFRYEEESARGFDDREDLAAPGVFEFDLEGDEAILILAADTEGDLLPDGGAVPVLRGLRAAERRRRAGFPTRLHRAADDYLVRRGRGGTIIAGYPWFADWGRDTFIALRGLCLATGRLDEARGILLEWGGTVSGGMLPNRFPDRGDAPEFNSVDASLWYLVAVHDYLRARAASGDRVPPVERRRLAAAVEAIVSGYERGTRLGIRAEADGLLSCGEPGAQLTWMDAKVGDWVVTPRVGKPVEIQALWLNALWIASAFTGRYRDLLLRGLAAFAARFWNEERGYLNDVVDAGHRAGEVDASFRPNQILAVGGLPVALLEGDRARRVVDQVEARLVTPLGLRSLAPGERGYTRRYQGGVRERDAAYHQGTAWPWLAGPFAEAWVRVRGGTSEARREARRRFLLPLLAHLDEAGLGHISEIADADPPHVPRGRPFQAWSVGEALRLQEAVLAETTTLADSVTAAPHL